MDIACRKLGLTKDKLSKTINNLYNNKNWSIMMIADYFNLTYGSTRLLMERYGIKRRKFTKSPRVNKQLYQHSQEFYKIYGFKSDEDLKSHLIELYTNMSQIQIAKKFGCCVGQISGLFKKFNISVRTFFDSSNRNIINDVEVLDRHKQIINGIMLGDGHLARRSITATIKYTCKHKLIIMDLANQLPFKSRIHERHKSNSTHYNLATLSYKQLIDFHNKWYKDKIKIVPTNIDLTPLTCYWWFVGDGTSGNNCLKLYTNAFTYNEVNMLVNKLNELGIACYTITMNNKNKKQPVIYVPMKGVADFLQYIGPCKHKDYDYKWIIRSKGKKIMDLREQHAPNYEQH